MSEDKKKVTAAVEPAKENEKKEIPVEQLGEVTGGGIGNVRYTPTKPISEDTKNKI